MGSPSSQAQPALGSGLNRIASLFLLCVSFAPHASRVFAGTPAVYPPTVGIEVNAGGELCNAVFSPDGRLFATASRDGCVVVWDTLDGTRLTAFNKHKHDGGYRHVPVYFLEGGLVASTAQKDVVFVWEARTGKVVHEIKAGSDVRTFAVSPDKQLMVILRSGQPPLVAGISDGREIATLKGPNGDVDQSLGALGGLVLFTPDSRQCITATKSERSDFDRAIRVWDLPKGSEPRLLGSGVVRDWLVSADGAVLTVLAGDDSLRQYRLSDGQQLKTFEEDGLVPGSVAHMFLYADDTHICIDDGTRFSLWDLKSKKKVSPPMVDGREAESTTFRNPAIDPGGKICVISDGDGVLRFYSPPFVKQVFSIGEDDKKHNRDANRCVFSPDGQRLAVLWASGKATLFSITNLTVHAANDQTDAKVAQSLPSAHGTASEVAPKQAMAKRKEWPTTKAEDGKHIDLKGHTSLSDEDAADLASREWAGLYLKDVSEISDSALTRLAGHDGRIVLSGITHLSPAAALALGKHTGELILNGVTAASDDVLECLSANRTGMRLDGLRELSDRGAEILGTTHKGGFLRLDGVLALSETQAAHLAGHQGIVYLLGVKSLTPEASHALATNAYGVILPDSPDFSEDIRRRLSGHCAGCSLGFVDLPQYFGPDPKWRAVDVGGVPITDALVKSAVSKAIGKQGTGTEPLELGGVRLGTPFRDLRTDDGQPDVFEEGYHTFTVRKRGEESQPVGALTFVKVDALMGNVVCIHRPMPDTSFSEVMQSIVERFGKTPQEIVEETSADGLFSSKRTIIRYAYPRAIARIQEYISVNRRSGRESSEVVVSLLSRPWVEENLHAYGSSVLSACQWATKAMAELDGKAFQVNDIPVLPGTERRAAAEGAHAFFIDAARQQWAQRAKNFRKDEFLERAYQLMPSPIVAAVGTVPTEDGKAVAFIAIRPLLSTSAGLRPIMTVDRYSGTNDISETPANDMLKEVANPLVQKCFPPTTDKISVIKVQRPPDVTLGQMLNNEGGVREINAMYRQSEGSRYEWQCRDGWTVRVCFDGHVYLLKTPQRAID